MSIRIGIYDFFAYMIPGGLNTFLAFICIWQPSLDDFFAKVAQMNFNQSAGLLVVSYVAGYVFDPLISRWARLFEPDFQKKVSGKVQNRYGIGAQTLRFTDWPIWLASIRRESLDLSIEIERHMVICKMLRGVSVFLGLLGLALGLGVIGQKVPVVYLMGVPIFGLFSWITLKQAYKFNYWYYLVIFETVIARGDAYVYKGKE